MRSHNWGTLFSGRPRTVTYGLAIAATMSVAGMVSALSAFFGLPGAATLLGSYVKYDPSNGIVETNSRAYGVVMLLWAFALAVSILRATSPNQLARLAVIGLTGVTGLFVILVSFSQTTGRGVLGYFAIAAALWLPCFLLLSKSANDFYEDLDFRF